MKAAGLILALLLLAPATRATEGQFTVVDTEYTADSWYGRWKFGRIGDPQPEDWTSPHNYKDGYTYERYEVIRFGGEPRQVAQHSCYFQDKHTAAKHACTQKTVRTEPGVYYKRFCPGKLWQADVIDYKRPLLSYMMIDNATKGKCKAEIKLTVIAVAKGFKLRAPTDWHDCPKSWDVQPHGTYGGLSYEQVEHLKDVAALLERGRLGAAWSAAERYRKDKDPNRSAEAARVLEALERHAQARREPLLALKAINPVQAVESLIRLARAFAPSQQGKKLLEEARAWNAEPATRNERTAQRIYAVVKETGKKLQRKVRGRKLTDPKVARKHGREIGVIRHYALVLKKNYPATASCKRALALAAQLGIAMPE